MEIEKKIEDYIKAMNFPILNKHFFRAKREPLDFKKIEGDASARKFYRNTKKNSIIVFANIEKIKNLLIYDSINKILIKNNIIAPKLLSQNYRNNYIEIQDLGNKTIYQTFINNKKNHFLILKKVNVHHAIQM